MTRDMTLTVALMLSSIAAAVAAPEIDFGTAPGDSVEIRLVADDAYTLGALGTPRAQPIATHGALPAPTSGTVDAMATACSADTTEPYRAWHYDSARVAVAGCGPQAST